VLNLLLLTPVILSLLLLAAHFWRAGLVPLALTCALLPLLLLVRRPWLPRLMQLVLVLGALEWLRTLYMLAAERLAFGQPVLRMAIILGSVAVVTVLSGWAFSSASLQKRYRRQA
jgi:hypothetical protein